MKDFMTRELGQTFLVQEITKWLDQKARPESLADGCVTLHGERLLSSANNWHEGPCAAHYPLRGNPRTAAGIPLARIRMKCALRPLEDEDYAGRLSMHHGLYVTHMRDEADGIVQSVQETLRIGRELGTPVVISHHKCMGHKNFGRSAETLALLEQARRQQSVALDVYPYTAGSSVLNDELVEAAEKTVITWCEQLRAPTMI